MKTDSLSNKTYFEVRKKILSSQLIANRRLKEDEWAKKVGASRMAVREALSRLLGEGLVYRGERGGYYVKPLLPEKVHEIREVREVIELGAMRLAFRKMTKKKLEKLEKICDDFTHMTTNGYYNGAVEADLKFHETLIDCAENVKLMEVYRSLHIPLFHQKLAESNSDVNDYELTDVEHRQVVKALRDSNLPLAEETLIKHFTRGEAVVLNRDNE
jgi:DNA-binding GntR family transcriptional regulator